ELLVHRQRHRGGGRGRGSDLRGGPAPAQEATGTQAQRRHRDGAGPGRGDDPPLRRRLPPPGGRQPAPDPLPDGEVPGQLSTAPAPQTRDELRQLHRRYREATSEAEKERIREQLVRGYDNLVRFLARPFANRGEPLEDILQVGYLGLIKAIDRFDPDLVNEFTTFATPTIRGEIQRYFRDKGWAIRLPRRLQEIYQQVIRTNEELKNELGRQPSVAEVAARLGIDPDGVLEAMEMGSAMVPTSIDAQVGGEDGEGRQLGETVGGAEPNLDRVQRGERL